MTPADQSRNPAVRISDADREAVAELLRDAHAEGRLSYEEFSERLDAVFAARTRGELVPITRDLPQAPRRRAPAPATSPDRRPARSGWIPIALRSAWYAWGVAVSINVVVWLIVQLSNPDDFLYFWPAWVAGPWGAVLVVATISARQWRQRPARHRPGPPPLTCPPDLGAGTGAGAGGTAGPRFCLSDLVP